MYRISSNSSSQNRFSPKPLESFHCGRLKIVVNLDSGMTEVWRGQRWMGTMPLEQVFNRFRRHRKWKNKEKRFVVDGGCHFFLRRREFEGEIILVTASAIGLLFLGWWTGLNFAGFFLLPLMLWGFAFVMNPDVDAIHFWQTFPQRRWVFVGDTCLSNAVGMMRALH